MDARPTRLKLLANYVPSLPSLRAGLPAIPIEKLDYAAMRAGQMYDCYRRNDASNADVFLRAATKILARYPDDVIETVTDPERGLPGTLKWPPQPSEVKEACEALMAPQREQAAWDFCALIQFAERENDERDAIDAPAMEKKRAEAVQEVAAASLRERFGLTREQWDALPGRATP